MDWWSGKEGSSYTDESILMSEQEKLFAKKHNGLELKDLYWEIFQDLDRNMRILEVGSNIGHKLRRLHMMGFKNLYGLEINPKTVNLARNKYDNEINFIQGSIQSFYTAEKFDLVMTNYVLQHIKPEEQNAIMEKIMLLSRKYVFGLEFFDESTTPVPVTWKGRDDLTWKKNWLGAYTSITPKIIVLKTLLLPRPDGFNDTAFLFAQQHGQT